MSSGRVAHLTPPCHDQTEKLDTVDTCDSVIVTMTRIPNKRVLSLSVASFACMVPEYHI